MKNEKEERIIVNYRVNLQSIRFLIADQARAFIMLFACVRVSTGKKREKIYRDGC